MALNWRYNDTIAILRTIFVTWVKEVRNMELGGLFIVFIAISKAIKKMQQCSEARFASPFGYIQKSPPSITIVNP
jgi:hypothetical protein